MKLVEEELSGIRARDRVEEITRYHRIQASPGIRQAACMAHKKLEQAGLEVETLEFAADGKTRFWGARMPEEWECQEAWLKLVGSEGESELLASFEENPISLIQRSGPTPGGVIEAEIVVLDEADQEEAYGDLEVEGKIVLTAADVGRAHQLAVEERGALGILTDQIRYSEPTRPEMDLPWARQYTSFWWAEQEKRGFGFVLSPRQGARIRKLAARSPESPPVVRALVKSRFYPGTIEVVSGLIRGRTQEEVLVVAHLCHPRPSANDNASGAGLVLEVARTLGQLYRRGDLDLPRRTIRFLLLPEMTGTYAYLAQRGDDVKRIRAAVNLDMVGQDQEACGSTLQVESPPRAMPSYTATLLTEIMEGIAQEITNLSGNTRFPSFRWTVTPFSGGSDHYILSDPTVGVGCPMLIQWPDRFYHTDQDTMDKVDPGMLKRIGTATAVYAAFLADAGYPQAVWLASQMTSRLAGQLREAVAQLWSSSPQPLRKVSNKLGFLATCLLADMDSLKTLVEEDRQEDFQKILESCQEESAHVLGAAVSRLEWLIKESKVAEARMEPHPVPGEESRLVPVRLVPGPIPVRDHLLNPRDRAEWYQLSKKYEKAGSWAVTAMYWMDGKRTLGQVMDLAEVETGQRHPEFLLESLKFLERLGLVRLESEPEDGEAQEG